MGLKLFVILVAPILKRYPTSKGILLDFSEAHDESAKATLSQYRSNLESVMIDYPQPYPDGEGEVISEASVVTKEMADG